jgi:hypothetical protein
MQIYVKLAHPDYGYDHDQKAIENINTDDYYPVEDIVIGGFHTSFTIKGLNEVFNSVQFDFYNEKHEPVDIFSIPEINPYIQTTGGIK